MPHASPHTPSPASPDRARPPQSRQLRGFTLIELLVVIGIIALLAGILIPAVSHVRIAGYETSTKAEIQTLMGVIEQYHNTFNYYPGPVPNSGVIGANSPVTNAPTGTENMTLGLMGGWIVSGGKFSFLATDVGLGANMNLNPVKVGRYPSFIDASTGNLQKKSSSGAWVAGGNELLVPYGNVSNLFKDTAVPEFTDRFPDPLPILYIRASVGATAANSQGQGAQYNTNELKVYNFPEPNTARVKSPASSNKNDPYLAAAASGSVSTSLFDRYFQNPNQLGTPYSKDGYILISAGRDRIYMSLDDLNSFGSPK